MGSTKQEDFFFPFFCTADRLLIQIMAILLCEYLHVLFLHLIIFYEENIDFMTYIFVDTNEFGDLPFPCAEYRERILDNNLKDDRKVCHN